MGRQRGEKEGRIYIVLEVYGYTSRTEYIIGTQVLKYLAISEQHGSLYGVEAATAKALRT